MRSVITKVAAVRQISTTISLINHHCRVSEIRAVNYSDEINEKHRYSLCSPEYSTLLEWATKNDKICICISGSNVYLQKPKTKTLTCIIYKKIKVIKMILELLSLEVLPTVYWPLTLTCDLDLQSQVSHGQDLYSIRVESKVKGEFTRDGWSTDRRSRLQYLPRILANAAGKNLWSSSDVCSLSGCCIMV